MCQVSRKNDGRVPDTHRRLVWHSVKFFKKQLLRVEGKSQIRSALPSMRQHIRFSLVTGQTKFGNNLFNDRLIVKPHVRTINVHYGVNAFGSSCIHILLNFVFHQFS